MLKTKTNNNHYRVCKSKKNEKSNIVCPRGFTPMVL